MPAVQTSPRKSRRGLALLVLTCVLALISYVALESGDMDLAHGCAIATATTSLLWLAAAAYRETGNALHPICLCALCLMLHFPFHAAVTRGKNAILATLGGDADRWSVYALLLVAFVYPFLWVGYRSRLAERVVRRLPHLGRAIDDEHPSTLNKLVVVYAVGLVARVASIATNLAFHFLGSLQGAGTDSAEYQNLIWNLVSLPTIVTLYVFATGFRQRSRRRVLAGVALGLGEIGWALISGSRGKLIMPIAALLVVMSDLWRPIRARHIIALFAVFMLVVFPFISGFRDAYFDQMASIEREGVESSTLVNSLSSALDTKSDRDPFEALATRMHGLTSLALILRYTPERQDWLYGVPYLELPAQVLVPRLLWHDKPFPAEFMDTFRRNYWGLERGDDTSIATTQIGELYVNLHIVGCVLGTMLFGVVLRMLRDHLRYGAGSTSVYPLAVSSLILIQAATLLEGPLVGYLAGLPKNLLVYVAVAWFLGRRDQRQPATKNTAAHA